MIPDIDLSQFNHCHSTDPPLKRVLITYGKYEGCHGYLHGRWDSDYRKWTIQLADGSTDQWVSLLPSRFKIVAVDGIANATGGENEQV